MINRLIQFAGNKKIQEKLFIIIFSLYILSSLITITMFEQIPFISIVFKSLRYLTYIFFLWFSFIFLLNLSVYNLNDRISIYQIFKNIQKELISRPFIIISIVVSFCVLIFSRNRLPIIVVFILIGGSQFDIKKILKLVLVINISLTIVTIISSEFGIIPEIIIGRGDGTLRYSLGFVYPLELMCNYLFIIMIYIYIFPQNYSLKELIVTNIINILLFKLTDARTSFILIILVSIIGYYIKFIDITRMYCYLKKWVLCSFAIICSFGSIILAWVYNENIHLFAFLNNLLSNRLFLGNQGLKNFGISMFGKQIEWVGFGAQIDLSYASQNYNFIDCSYIKNLLDFGVFFFLLIIIGYIYILIRLYNQKDVMGIIVFCFIFLVSIVEPRLFQIEMNPFLLMIGTGLTNKIYLRKVIKNEI